MATQYIELEPHDWGMVWDRTPVAENLNDPEHYVHHTAGGEFGHTDDGPAIFRALNRNAIEGRDYSAVAYDTLVYYSPRLDICWIGVARGRWLSAATYRRNEQGEATGVVGYFHPGHSLSRHPYPQELEGTARAIAKSIKDGYTAPDAWIGGHRDNPNQTNGTPCPGDFFYPKLPTIRKRVAELLAPPQENDMNSPLIRLAGYKDQFLVIPLSGDTKNRLGLADDKPLVVTANDSRNTVETHFGYKLTKI